MDTLSLDVAAGEFIVLLGPSGCGKSTILRLVAGLEDISSGALFLDGEHVNDLPPRERDVAMVFQDFALYPNMDVRENIGFPLRMSRVGEPEIRQRVGQLAEMLGITDYLRLRPASLSGGERQRVAMGRALARRPSLFLMDEPLSNLDAKLRASVRAEVLGLTRRAEVTTMYVTHDQAEAMTMGDRVAVLRDGVLQQLGTSKEIYERPANVFVAAFVGNPRINLIGGVLRRSTTAALDLDLGSQRLPLRGLIRYPAHMLENVLGEPVIVGIRPEWLVPVSDTAEEPVIRGRVRHVEFLGHEVLAHVDAGLQAPRIGYLEAANPSHLPRHRPSRRKRRFRGWKPGRGGRGKLADSDMAVSADPRLSFSPELSGAQRSYRNDLVIRLPARAYPAVGSTLTLRVDTQRMHLFDFAGKLLPSVLLPEGTPRRGDDR